jgi:hypothetical protein
MNYIGNCTEDNAMELIFSNASDMACVIEDSVKVNSKEKFFNKIGNSALNGSFCVAICNEFGYHEDRNIAWGYDKKHDIHYFWH